MRNEVNAIFWRELQNLKARKTFLLRMNIFIFAYGLIFGVIALLNTSGITVDAAFMQTKLNSIFSVFALPLFLLASFFFLNQSYQTHTLKTTLESDLSTSITLKDLVAGKTLSTVIFTVPATIVMVLVLAVFANSFIYHAFFLPDILSIFQFIILLLLGIGLVEVIGCLFLISPKLGSTALVMSFFLSYGIFLAVPYIQNYTGFVTSSNLFIAGVEGWLALSLLLITHYIGNRLNKENLVLKIL